MNILYQIGRIGFFLSLFTHAATFRNMNLQEEVPVVWLLHFGVFLVWIPTVMIAWGYLRRIGWREFRIWLRNAIPSWMKVACIVLFVYGMANYFYNFYKLNEGGVPAQANGKYVLKNNNQIIRQLSESEYEYHQTINVRSFSGQWMTFYFLSMAVLNAAKKNQANVR